MASRVLAPLLLCLLTASRAADSPPASPEKTETRVDALFQKMDTTISPGCALSVIRDHKIIYKRGYGMADLDHNIPITPATVFHVASMSKQFTAAAILLLAAEGKLSLDDPVRKYIAELPDFGAPVTIAAAAPHQRAARSVGAAEPLRLADFRGPHHRCRRAVRCLAPARTQLHA